MITNLIERLLLPADHQTSNRDQSHTQVANMLTTTPIKTLVALFCLAPAAANAESSGIFVHSNNKSADFHPFSIPADTWFVSSREAAHEACPNDDIFLTDTQQEWRLYEPKCHRRIPSRQRLQLQLDRDKLQHVDRGQGGYPAHSEQIRQYQHLTSRHGNTGYLCAARRGREWSTAAPWRY